MRARTTAIAAAACALALLPAASAVAGSGPPPAPDTRQSAESTAPSAAGNPHSRRARAAGVCSDAHEIGSRGVIYRNSEPVGSVKQFYSPDCNENYGYLWVWNSFHNAHTDYDVSIGVHNYAQGAVLGKRTWYDTNAQEFWSNPASTASVCTSALGTIRASGDPIAGNAWSTKRC